MLGERSRVDDWVDAPGQDLRAVDSEERIDARGEEQRTQRNACREGGRRRHFQKHPDRSVPQQRSGIR